MQAQEASSNLVMISWDEEWGNQNIYMEGPKKKKSSLFGVIVKPEDCEF